jgi:hypothetical protein
MNHAQVTRTPAQAAEHERIEVRNDPVENSKNVASMVA